MKSFTIIINVHSYVKVLPSRKVNVHSDHGIMVEKLPLKRVTFHSKTSAIKPAPLGNLRCAMWRISLRMSFSGGRPPEKPEGIRAKTNRWFCFTTIQNLCFLMISSWIILPFFFGRLILWYSSNTNIGCTCH